jgi:S-adenosylmethionine:tRNA ribosyltransferase-isomerase
MDLADFDYALPPGAIAQAPAEPRDASRLLVVDRATGALADRRFADLPDLLRPDDCVVLNDSRVLPARVLGQSPGPRRGPVELLFVEPAGEGRWLAMVRPGKRGRAGAKVTTPGGARLSVVAAHADGLRVVERLDGTIEALMASEGLPPLPPYIARHGAPAREDRDRYQTVYARTPGSVAAPTAGLHLTPALLGRLGARGIEVHALTLHVGPATFRPITAATVEAHTLGSERATVPAATAAAVNRARAEGRRVVAVGTTVVRTLESAVGPDGEVTALDGRAGLYIVPGHRFRAIDALVTNFHLPRSTLLVLVAAFAGRERVLRAYAHALASGYRFYSYGDACLFR